MKIATVRGIGVYVHWTFWILIAIYLFSATAQAGLGAGLYAVAFIVSVFACVVAHEFGHAGAAAMYGIPTSDITLLPIGGVARLARIPEKPVQELVIALAGPAVNVVIAGVLLIPVVFGVIVGASAPALGSQLDFLAQLLAANIVLVVFNLLPAFPMDGGRVLRSLIAMRTTHLRATEIAAKAGRWMAGLFAIYGIVTGAYSLLLVAMFIFIAGTAELMGARARAMAGAGFDAGGFGPGFNGAGQAFNGWSQQGNTFRWTYTTGPTAQGHHHAREHDDVIEGEVIDATEVKRIQ